MTITPIQASTTQTAAFTGPSVNVSGIVDSGGNPRDWTLKLQIQALSDSVSTNTPQVRFTFFDSVNAFTASIAGPSFSFKGTITKNADVVRSFKRNQYPDLRIGVASAVLQLQLTDLEATGSCTYSAWLES